MKHIYLYIISLLLIACNGVKTDQNEESLSSSFTSKNEVPSDPLLNKGIGPVSSLELSEINATMVTEGEELFKGKCSACHKVKKRYIGPMISGVVNRRSPEWIMNMILNPEEMLEKDAIARELLIEYSSPMANQSLTKEEARKILEYFRTI